MSISRISPLVAITLAAAAAPTAAFGMDTFVQGEGCQEVDQAPEGMPDIRAVNEHFEVAHQCRTHGHDVIEVFWTAEQDAERYAVLVAVADGDAWRVADIIKTEETAIDLSFASYAVGTYAFAIAAEIDGEFGAPSAFTYVERVDLPTEPYAGPETDPETDPETGQGGATDPGHDAAVRIAELEREIALLIGLLEEAEGDLDEAWDLIDEFEQKVDVLTRENQQLRLRISILQKGVSN